MWSNIELVYPKKQAEQCRKKLQNAEQIRADVFKVNVVTVKIRTMKYDLKEDDK